MPDRTHRQGLFQQSLSARRAWIEILVLFGKFVHFVVALRKESVDRNISRGNGRNHCSRRSPQGERG